MTFIWGQFYIRYLSHHSLKLATITFLEFNWNLLGANESMALRQNVTSMRSEFPQWYCQQCMKWPVAHSPNSTWFWLELVGNCCERLKIIMKYTNIQFCERLGHGWQFHPLLPVTSWATGTMFAFTTICMSALSHYAHQHWLIMGFDFHHIHIFTVNDMVHWYDIQSVPEGFVVTMHESPCEQKVQSRGC